MFTNALAHEKSPYLRQHAHNPVDWLAWAEPAFEKARREDKPIFLSIGYSTCHWCHVMAHESFEDPAVAEILNRDFVPIKLDREERPDIDRIYMLFVQASTGSGGWPMSVWLTPSLKPFFGGTYFPPGNRYGRPGFKELLGHIASVWKSEREKLELSSVNVTEQLRSMARSSTEAVEPSKEIFTSAFWQLHRTFDSRWGGFNGAPKFPRPVLLNYLIRFSILEDNPEALDMVLLTLQAMAAGGMNDQLGGGFHRYSVDERWFVPHFEKMLYDQAQLAIAYLEAYQLTARPEFATTAREIFSYVLRDLTSPEGGFYSAEDADSPDPENPRHSGEGAFYVWRQSEIERILGSDNASFIRYFNVDPEGNVENDPHGEFRGRNILFRGIEEDVSGDLTSARNLLLAARSERPRPHLDNKILTSWNALQISAFAKGFLVLGDVAFLEAARKGAAFLIAEAYSPETGRLSRTYCDGPGSISGFLDDYAFLAQALLDLFEVTFDATYLDLALDLARCGLARFEDPDGGFFGTEADASNVLFRMKDDYDGAEPSGNSVATDVLLRLAHLTGDQTFRDRAERSLRAFAPKLKAQPTMAPQMLVALGRLLSEPEQVILRCEQLDQSALEALAEYTTKFHPNKVVLAVSDALSVRLRESAPFLSSLERKGRLTIYECRNFTCELPKVIQ